MWTVECACFSCVILSKGGGTQSIENTYLTKPVMEICKSSPESAKLPPDRTACMTGERQREGGLRDLGTTGRQTRGRRDVAS